MTNLRRVLQTLTAGIFLLLLPQMLSAQGKPGWYCSYCAAPVSCVQDDGSGPMDRKCWMPDPYTCSEEMGCEGEQSFVPNLGEDERLQIEYGEQGVVVLAKVSPNTFMTWKTCDGSPAIVAIREATGEVRMVEPTERPGLPTYYEWIAERSGL